MPTFKNKTDEVFQDGDLIVAPGESFSTEDEARAEQMRVQYAWQFEEAKGGKNTPSEEQIKDEKPGTNLRELRTGGHVAVDESGKQSEKVGE
jgi:hypothetical protein